MSVSRGRQLQRSSGTSQSSSLGHARSHFSRSPSPPAQEDKGRRRSKSRHGRKNDSGNYPREKENWKGDKETESHKETLGKLKKLIKFRIGRSPESTEPAQAGQASVAEVTGLGPQTIEERLKKINMPPIAPCPFIHPLKNRLVARDDSHHNVHEVIQRKASLESLFGPPLRPSSKGSSNIGIAVTRVPDLRPKTPKTPKSSMSNFNFNAGNLRFLETMARDAALERKNVQEWAYFLRYYSEGRYNPSFPPDPPPRRENLDFLIAPNPPNEKERLRAVQRYNVLPVMSSVINRLERLVQISRKLCQARMCAISIINNDMEVFKAQDSSDKTLQISPIERAFSMGGHALLTEGAMVVLDTLKDWRFHGNQLVVGEPRIRFFAGAPITTFEGHTIGVLALYDTVPRAEFSQCHKRKLMEMAKLAMTDLDIVLEDYESSRVSLVPSLTTSDSTVSTTASRSMDDRDSFRSNRSRARVLSVLEEESDVIRTTMPSPIESPISTPELWTSPPRSHRPPQAESKGPHHRPALPLLTVSSQRAPLPLANRSGPLIVNPSPTSIMSDVPTPPDTPSRLYSSHSECPPRYNLQIPITAYAPINSPKFIVTPTEVIDFSDGDDDDHEHFGYPLPHFEYGLPVLSDQRRVNLGQFPAVPRGTNLLMETTNILTEIAEGLGYDLVYLMRLKPSQPDIHEDYLLAGELETRIIASHGLPDPCPGFDPVVHLRALRNDGGIRYQNAQVSDGEQNDGSDYEGGIILPVHRDIFEEVYLANSFDDEFAGMHGSLGVTRVVNQTCRGGVVIAAFKFNIGTEDSMNLDQMEAKNLENWIQSLRGLLLRSPSGWA